MERNTKTITYGESGETDKKSTFSTAMFQANAGDADIDIDAIDFWEKILPEKKTARKLQERLEDGSLESKEKLRQWWKDLEELSLNVMFLLRSFLLQMNNFFQLDWGSTPCPDLVLFFPAA